ncbi:MAG: RNA-binding protein [Clostridia bacterium]|nr:RNA-binding protein [Clostridia bacterium]
MIHEMKLNEKPFNNIDKGIKKIELRLFDEKRAKINLNDYIVFKNIVDSTQTLKVKVVGLLRYNTFEDLFKDVDYNICGPANSFLKSSPIYIKSILKKKKKNMVF